MSLHRTLLSKFLFFRYLNFLPVRPLSHILGIETSCDDTGLAVLDEEGKVVCETIASQNSITSVLGGILPTIAHQLHAKNISELTQKLFTEYDITWKNFDSIAVTVQPGMALSLDVGLNYAKQQAAIHNLPIIPIHHMEAHALTAKFTNPELQYPYLVSLMSGGHALIALTVGLEDFVLLGTTLDSAPGSVLDKLARRLKLSRLNDPRLRHTGGGRAIEICASLAQLPPAVTNLTVPRSSDRDCDFSFSGLLLSAERLIAQLEADAVASGKQPNEPLPMEVLSNLCCSVQYALTKQICRRLQRAFEFLKMPQHTGGRLPWPTALVVSGGVAANATLRAGLLHVAQAYDLPLIAPPPRLCTDNGVMIAWNGWLLRRANRRIVTDPSSLFYMPDAPLGVDCRALVRQANIKIDPINLKHILTGHTRTYEAAVE